MIEEKQALIHHFLEKSAYLYPDKIALIHNDIRITYKEINILSNRLSSLLMELGLLRGDRVILIMQNSLEYVISYYGILKAGGVVVSLSTETKPDGLKSFLKELEPFGIITGAKYEKLFFEAGLNALNIKVGIIKDPVLDWSDKGLKLINWDKINVSGEASNPESAIDNSSLSSIIYTSGSTGIPKGVMLTHKNIVTNVNSICHYLNLTDKDIQMVVLPFFYVMGKSLLNTHFAVGGSIVINNMFAFTASVIKQMISENVTGFSGVPSTYAYLLHRSPLEKYRDSLVALRYCSQAGGHMSDKIKLELRRVLPEHTDIYIMYGATEASARLSYLPPKSFEEKYKSIGFAIPGVTLKIIDEKGEEAPAGQQGELTGSGDNIMQGYWKDPETSSRVLDHNGYHTGDLGYRDEDGFFYLVGRKDNLLKVSGHRINIQEVEDALIDSNLLVEAAVIGVPDELSGNRLIAVVTPINKECSKEDILSFCFEKLPKYKIPSEIVFTKALPKKASGKIDREKCLALTGDF